MLIHDMIRKITRLPSGKACADSLQYAEPFRNINARKSFAANPGVF
jgi:hypothetical protein